MHEIVLGIFVFIGAIFISFLFAEIMPGGNLDVKLVWGAILSLDVTTAICTSFILKEMNKKKQP